jgi:hypothetical protein
MKWRNKVVSGFFFLLRVTTTRRTKMITIDFKSKIYFGLEIERSGVLDDEMAKWLPGSKELTFSPRIVIPQR